jgi:hypothetical protein
MIEFVNNDSGAKLPGTVSTHDLTSSEGVVYYCTVVSRSRPRIEGHGRTFTEVLPPMRIRLWRWLTPWRDHTWMFVSHI